MELNQAELHARWEDAERIRVAALPPPPAPKPPPTKDELADESRRKYEWTVRMLGEMDLNEMERNAGLSQAKQKLLKDLEKVM